MAPAYVIEAPVLMNLDYAPEVPAQLLSQVEVLAKSAGVPLERIELIGQDYDACERFVDVAQSIGVDVALEELDWGSLESTWYARQA